MSIHGRRSAALVVGTAAILALACGCGGGSAAGGTRLVGTGGGAASGAGTGPTTGGSTGGTFGPTIGAPSWPVLYVLVTTDNATRTALPESISGEAVSSGAALAPMPAASPTSGTGHQNISSSGFAASRDRSAIFVGHNASATVEAFLLKTDGSLLAGASGPVQAGQATSIAVHPSLAMIYVSQTAASAAASTVRTFAYDRASGALAPASSLGVADSLRGLAVDPTGRFLATTHMFGGGRGVAVYGLDAAGVPVAPAIATAAISSGRPASAAFDRTGTRLYVRNLDAGVHAYTVSAQGTLAPLNGGNSYAVPGFSSDLVVSPSLDLLYVLTAFTSEIHGFKIGATGALTAIPKLALNDNCQHLAIGRTGNYLFATSRTTSHIRAFSIDPSTGTLTENGLSPFAVANSAGMTGSIVVND